MTPEDSSTAPPLWQFIRLSEYGRPPEPAAERVHRGLWRLWDRLRRTQKPATFDHLEMRRVAEDLLLRAASEPDWRQAVPALAEEFKDWLASGGQADPLQVVVGAPYSGTGFAARHWAAENNWRLIEPPAAEQLLTGAREWLNSLDASEESPWIIPCLEKCYLRHYNGLEAIKTLLDKLSSRRHATLLACDSWAWAYLRTSVNIDSVSPTPYVLVAFDQSRLKRWLQTLAQFADEHPWVFRLPDGKVVFQSAGEDIESNQEEECDFLYRLAAHSRGIPGVAWSIWRCSLRFAPLWKNEDRENQPEEPERTMWVSPWESLDFPRIPKENRDRLALLLHTLLLHRGVSHRLLPELLPGLASEFGQDLHQLRAAGLVEREHGEWRVTALGYPAVRAFLQDEGFLVDMI